MARGRRERPLFWWRQQHRRRQWHWCSVLSTAMAPARREEQNMSLSHRAENLWFQGRPPALDGSVCWDPGLTSCQLGSGESNVGHACWSYNPPGPHPPAAAAAARRTVSRSSRLVGRRPSRSPPVLTSQGPQTVASSAPSGSCRGAAHLLAVPYVWAPGRCWPPLTIRTCHHAMSSAATGALKLTQLAQQAERTCALAPPAQPAA